MTLREFLIVALEPVPGMRPGQCFMNVLDECRPEIFDLIIRLGLDAFYDDTKLRTVIDIVTDRWNNPTKPTDVLR